MGRNSLTYETLSSMVWTTFVVDGASPFINNVSLSLTLTFDILTSLVTSVTYNQTGCARMRPRALVLDRARSTRLPHVGGHATAVHATYSKHP
jgi:hypothetical protein